jgi:hypothetical protein
MAAMADSVSLKMAADADFVCSEEFIGIIIKRRRRWLAIVPGCACCSPTEILGAYRNRTQAAIALAEYAEFNGFTVH